MGNMKYRRVIEMVTEKPWAILPSKLAQISQLLVFRANGGKYTNQEIDDVLEAEELLSHYAARRKDSPQQKGGKVAIIPLYGVITPRADVFSDMSGGTGMDQFMQAMSQAAADPSVSSIVMDVDSPGGQVDMVPEAAALIRQIRNKKPVTAVANTMAASAAYWLASQASTLLVSPSAEVGSIGVYAAHNDLSEAQAKLGVKTTLISAGKFKTELSPFEPLSEEARGYVQDQVNEYYSMFTKDVANGRGVSATEVRTGFGEGRMVTAQRAVQAKMADGVDTFDTAVSRALTLASSQGNGFSLSGFNIPYELTTTTSGTNTSGTTNITIKPTGWISPDELREAEQYADYYKENHANITEPEETDEPEPEEELEENDSDENATALGELKRASGDTSKSEREEYLALLRRLNK